MSYMMQAPSSSLPVGEGQESSSMVAPADFDAWMQMTRTVAHYERLEQIGEGTYGQVYRARCRDSGRIVALKKMRIHHGGYWGMPLQLIREIKILKRLRHKNLLRMIEVVTSKGVEHLDFDDPMAKNHQVKDKVADTRESYKGNLFLVLEYLDHDLTGLLDVAYQFTPVQIKCIFKQLLEALAFMHQNKYVHRDIKSSNLLLDSNFTLKLADFGLARSTEVPLFDQVQERKASLASGPDFTNKVITLWYRPPEILLGASQYGAAVDVWSAGCILAELILGKPLFAGKTELDQLNLILEMLGPPPSDDTYDFFESGMRKSKSGEPLSLSRNQKPPAKLRAKYREKIPPAALNLIEKMLAWDPRQRVTAENALTNRYFWTDPVAPNNPEDLGVRIPSHGHFHEFQTKKKRKQAKTQAEEVKERALLKGATEDQAQAEYDKAYRKLMKKVADEGLGANELPGSRSGQPTPADRSPERDDREDGRRSEDRERRRQSLESESRRSRDRNEDDSRRRSRSRRADSETGRKRRRDEGRRSRRSQDRQHRDEDSEEDRRRPADRDSTRNGDMMPRNREGSPAVRSDRGISTDRLPSEERDRFPRDVSPLAAENGRVGGRPSLDDADRTREPTKQNQPRVEPRLDDRDHRRDRDEKRRPDGRGRDRIPPDRPPFDERGGRREGIPLDEMDRSRGRLPFDDRPRDMHPYDNGGLPMHERDRLRGRDRPRDIPPVDDRGRPLFDDRDRPRDMPMDDRGRPRRDIPPTDDRGRPFFDDRERPRDTRPIDDRGRPLRDGPPLDNRGRPIFDDRDRFRDMPPMDERGRHPRDGPPLDERGRPIFDDRDRPRDMPPMGDRGRHPRDGPPLDDRGRPPFDERDRPRDLPPFDRERFRDGPQLDDRRMHWDGPPDMHPDDRNRRRMGPPPDERDRRRDRAFLDDRPRDLPPPGDERDLPRGRFPPHPDDMDRLRRPPPREDRGRYGPSGLNEEDRARHGQERPPLPDERPDREEGDKSGRRSGDNHRRRKKDKKRRRSRSRDRHESRRKERNRDDKANHYGPSDQNNGERRRDEEEGAPGDDRREKHRERH